MKTTTIIITLLAISSSIFFGFKLARPKQTEFKVQYAVECSSCSISYRDEMNRTITKENVTGNWEYSYTGNEGHYAFVSAQSNEKHSLASVKVIVDGNVKDSDSSEDNLASAKATRILYAD